MKRGGIGEAGVRRRSRAAPARLPTMTDSKSETAKMASGLDGMLKQFSTLAEKHKQKAQEIAGPPKEDIAFKVDKTDVFKGVDMDKTKDQLMQVLKSLKDASSVANDLTFQFAGGGGGGSIGGPQEEQMEYWFRRQQWASWNSQVLTENKVQVTRKSPAKTGEKNPAFHFAYQQEQTLVGTVVVGSKETNRFVKRLVYSKYDPVTLELKGDMSYVTASSDALVFPVAVFRSAPYLFTVVNVLQKNGNMGVALVRSRVWEEDKEGDFQVRVLEGLFDKGLQAVDLYVDDDKKAYLLVRGVSTDKTTGHGMGIIDMASGMVQQWINFAPVLDKYAELHGFHHGLDDMGGLVREFSSQSATPGTRQISVSYDRKTQSIAVHSSSSSSKKNQEDKLFCKKRAVAGTNGGVQLASCNLPQYSQTGKNPPQALIWSSRTLVLPDAFHIQKASSEQQGGGGGVLLLGTYTDSSSSDYLLARVKAA